MDDITRLALWMKDNENPSPYSPIMGTVISLPNLRIQVGTKAILDSKEVKWLDGREMSKELMIRYKAKLESKYEAASVNTMLSSLNSYFDYIGHPEYKVRNLKIQKSTYIEPKRELTKEEYKRLLKTAYDMGKHRIYYIMQTICSCGIRVSELKFITVEAIKHGVAYVSNKGKSRRVFIPNALSKLLQQYINLKKITSGMIFITRTGMRSSQRLRRQ